MFWTVWKKSKDGKRTPYATFKSNMDAVQWAAARMPEYLGTGEVVEITPCACSTNEATEKKSFVGHVIQEEMEKADNKRFNGLVAKEDHI